MQAYIPSKIYTGEEVLTDKYILVRDSIIIGILPINEIPENIQIIDLKGNNIAPAFIDLQIYGGGGSLFNTEPTVKTIQKTYDDIRKFGTKHFQITLSTVDLDTMLMAISACHAYQKNGGKGLIGLHLEGPYFNPIKKGAHIEKFVRKPTIAEINTILELSNGIVTYLTLAPEMCDDECLKLLIDNGIQISAGHSNATFNEAKSSFEKGIIRVTHLFNAMSAFQSREPGLVGAVYSSNVYASVVADGIHVNFEAIKISKQIMGSRLFYITDAVTEDIRGEYKFYLNGDHYINDLGILSGSALTMLQCVKNGVEKIGISLEESIRMASTIPAEVANLSNLGKIKAGYQADFVVFDDALNVVSF